MRRGPVIPACPAKAGNLSAIRLSNYPCRRKAWICGSSFPFVAVAVPYVRKTGFGTGERISGAPSLPIGCPTGFARIASGGCTRRRRRSWRGAGWTGNPTGRNPIWPPRVLGEASLLVFSHSGSRPSFSTHSSMYLASRLAPLVLRIPAAFSNCLEDPPSATLARFRGEIPRRLASCAGMRDRKDLADIRLHDLAIGMARMLGSDPGQ